jgi:hypothetical protein
MDHFPNLYSHHFYPYRHAEYTTSGSLEIVCSSDTPTHTPERELSDIPLDSDQTLSYHVPDNAGIIQSDDSDCDQTVSYHVPDNYVIIKSDDSDSDQPQSYHALTMTSLYLTTLRVTKLYLTMSPTMTSLCLTTIVT